MSIEDEIRTRSYQALEPDGRPYVVSLDVAVKIARQADAELTTLRTEITAYDIRMDNDAAEIARLRTELDQARADVEAAEASKAMLLEQRDVLLKQVNRSDQVVAERDNFEEWANLLAGAIAEYMGIDIGEHSNGNSPWANAYDEIKVKERFAGCDGCSTGDCPHGNTSECVQAQADLIATQEIELRRQLVALAEYWTIDVLSDSIIDSSGWSLVDPSTDAGDAADKLVHYGHWERHSEYPNLVRPRRQSKPDPAAAKPEQENKQ